MHEINLNGRSESMFDEVEGNTEVWLNKSDNLGSIKLFWTNISLNITWIFTSEK